MAIQIEKTIDFMGATGSPISNTKYDKLTFGFKSEGIKIIVSAGTLEVSLNGSDANPHMSLPVGSYDFVGMHVPALFIRNTGATAQVLAWAGE